MVLVHPGGLTTFAVDWLGFCGRSPARRRSVPAEDKMRFTFADTGVSAPRRSLVLLWARRAFDMIVIGAMVYAAVETVAFLRGVAG